MELGAEVYASDREEQVFCHTCKSRAVDRRYNPGGSVWLAASTPTRAHLRSIFEDASFVEQQA
jgi:hypothetical protein